MGHGRPEKFRLENHGKVLVVPGDEQDVGGKYMCKAKNPLGEVVHYFTVTVEGNKLESDLHFSIKHEVEHALVLCNPRICSFVVFLKNDKGNWTNVGIKEDLRI